MRLHRILALAAAAILAAGCGAGDATAPSADAARKGVNMGGSGGYTAPGNPRMDGSQMGGSGGYTGGSGGATGTTTTSQETQPADSTTLIQRGSQMGGSGG